MRRTQILILAASLLAVGAISCAGQFESSASSLQSPDIPSPLISNVAASAIGASEATIEWSTNEPSDSQVEYGTTTDYGYTSPLQTNRLWSHWVRLTDLTAETTYNYRLRSRDTDGNLAVSGNFTLTTAGSAALSCPGFVIEGFGRNATGGCGGRTIYVTNLNDSGPGSLREAVNDSGPRIVKFQVSGWITLASILNLNNSDITIDGSDAPNGGIGIRGAIFGLSVQNVILRHLRFRSGVTLPDGGNDVDRDAVQIGSDDNSAPYNVAIDHCEFAWGDDGNLDITNSAHDITVQWSMIYENFGPGNMLLGSGGIGDSGDGATRITLHHNLFAQGSRNPEINTGEGDLVNNVFYRNFDGRDFYGPGQHLGFANLTRVQPWDSPAPLWNIVGNYYKPGGLEYLVEPGRQRQIYFYGGLPQSGRALLYVEGNIGPSRPDEGRSELDIVNQNDGGLAISATRFSYPAVTTSTASQAYAEVVANAGATLPCRDAVSARVMSEVISGTGRYPEAEEDFGFYGGYPNLLRPCEGISRIMGRHERSPRTVK